jgi:hypothetical protein
MASYTIKVQLEGDPSYERYESLHAAMAELGFFKTIQGPNGVFDLPHGIYFGESMFEAKMLRDILKVAVQAKVQSAIQLFVAETLAWGIFGNLHE